MSKEAWINYNDVVVTSANPEWNDIAVSGTPELKLKDGVTLSGWLVSSISKESGSYSTISDLSGAAAWAPILTDAHRRSWTTTKDSAAPDIDTYSGFDQAKKYTVEVFCSSRVSNTVTWLQVNTETPQTSDNFPGGSDNNSDTVIFADVVPDAGKIYVKRAKASGADYGAVNVMRIIEQDAPPTASVTIDSEMTPGGTSVLTYDNFDAAPTGTVTATPLDGSGDPVSGFTPLTYTGTVSDTDTAGVHSGTVTVNWPALADGQTTLPFGTDNVRLSITS